MVIYLDDGDYRQFVHLLGEIVEDCAIRCWNYCLMPNHYHATVEPTRPNLSQAIRRLNGAYAQWWNKRHDRVGHVFQGRFKDQVVDRQSYLLALSRYVVTNPVRARLVARPEDWTWSSYRATVGHSPSPAFLDRASTLRLFGDETDAILRARFARYTSEQPDDWTSVDRIRSAERVLGPKDFKERVNECGRASLPRSDQSSPVVPELGGSA